MTNPLQEKINFEKFEQEEGPTIDRLIHEIDSICKNEEIGYVMAALSMNLINVSVLFANDLDDIHTIADGLKVMMINSYNKYQECLKTRNV